MTATPTYKSERFSVRKSDLSNAGIAACETVAASAWALRRNAGIPRLQGVLHVQRALDVPSDRAPQVGGPMKHMTISTRTGGFRRKNTSSLRTTVPSPASTAIDLVTSSTSSDSPTTELPAGCRARRSQPALREARAQGAERTIGQVVREAAANPVQFQTVIDTLMLRARLQYWKLLADREHLMQEACELALKCEEPAGSRDFGAFIWKRFEWLAWALIRQRKLRAKLEDEHAAEIAKGFGFKDPVARALAMSPDAPMVSAVDDARRVQRAIRKMTGAERLAFNLWVAGSPAAKSGLHRHALRHALAKIFCKPSQGSL